MKRRVLIMVLLLAAVQIALGAGCARLENLHPFDFGAVEKAAPAPSGAEEVLIFLQYVQGLPAQEQAREYDRYRASFEENGAPGDRLILACLALLPGKSFSDREYSLQLLEGYPGGGSVEKDGMDGLAGLLVLLAADHLRADAERVRFKRQNRVLIEKLGSLDELERTLEQEREHTRELSRQLKELKAIEDILTDRERRGVSQ
ncbi:MAG: hypothetical protein C0617_00890 [Desulfuromonas sp.]|uniref:hypothetical protein n=1 Tax=Desulfuromonas sp. TaxID=892 RepID=UPI000CB5439F|nr:hypothetical protein [Desulfuromonas sp.]PLX86500.1 MAG: hypothetical protein C0617_00890 [Desulfuromonas sp.]